MPIPADLQSLFSPADRARGAAILRAGGLASVERNSGGWTGTITGDRYEHRVWIADAALAGGSPATGTALLGCDCETFADREPCEHLWALVRALDEDGLIPPAAAIRDTDWFRALREVAFDGPLLAQDPIEADLELGYAVALVDEGLLVRILARRPRASGKAGRWRPLPEVGIADEGLMPPADQRLLALMRGMVQLWERHDLLRHSSDCLVPAAAIPVLAPLLAATGRARALAWNGDDPSGFDQAPLFRTADGPPDRFEAHLVPAEGGLALEARVQPTPAEAADRAEPRFYWIDDGVLHAVDVGPAPALARLLIGRGPIRIPADQTADFLFELGQLPDGERLVAPQVVASPEPPRPWLWIHTRAPLQRTKYMEATLGFRYGEQRIEADAAASLLPAGDGVVRRDREAEARSAARLRELGAAPGEDRATWRIGLSALRPLIAALLADGVEVHAQGVPVRAGGTPKISVASGTDWFDLGMEIQFEGAKIALPEILDALRSGTKIVSLDDGSLGLLPEDWLAAWERALGLGELEGQHVRFRRSQAWILDALLAAKTADLDAAFQALRERIAGFGGIRPAKPKRGFRGQLRPYQREGLGWLDFLSELGLGGCLADDMGLGKTVQVLAHLHARHPSPDGRPSLVVAPRSLIFNWQREAARFTPKLAVHDFTGPDRWAALGIDDEVGDEELPLAFAAFDLVLTTYGTLRRDAARLRHVPFEQVILDEAQAIKNAQSQVAKAVRLLDGRQRLALSGTPVENHLDELWSIFEFLNPGMLGRSKPFRALVERTSAEGERRIGPQLRDALRPFLLRRTKEQVLDDLPPKSEQIVEVELEAPQRRFYTELRDHVRAGLLDQLDAHGLESSQIQVLQALLRLRQAACHPALVDARHQALGSAKLDALLPMLEEVVEGGHKALVFSQFTSFLAHLRAALDARGQVHEYLDGQTRNRQERVERFQEDPACPLFLISLKAGGQGLNLTAADYVFLLDPWWNPAVESQAVDRAHRIGQRQKVMVYRLIARDTIEQKVLDLQAQKRELAAALFDDSGGATLRDLSRADLEALLGA
jgi:superfamily II DNA or RNA helicase